jgi:hypothetical protein
VLGGLLAEFIGLRPTLAAAAIGELGAAVWLWCSPIRSLMVMPDIVDDDTDQDADDSRTLEPSQSG